MYTHTYTLYIYLEREMIVSELLREPGRDGRGELRVAAEVEEVLLEEKTVSTNVSSLNVL